MNKKLSFPSFLRPERVSGVLLLIMVAVFFFRPVETGDIWWHLKAGEYIHGSQTVPLLDPFPVDGEKTLWILTQWLGSVIYYMVYHAGGLLGLKLFRVLIVLLGLWQFRRFTIRYGLGRVYPFLGFLLMLAVAGRPHLRPFLFNILFIQVFLSGLFNFSRTSRIKALIPLAVVAPLWVNMHMGSFVYGFTLIGVFLLAAAVAAVKRGSGRRAMILGAAAVLYAAAFLLNPYGIHGALHPIKTLFDPGYLNFGLIRDAISELQPPHLWAWSYAWVWPVIALGALAVYSDREHSFRNLLLIACAFFLFLYGQRAAVFFALVTMYVFVDAYDPKRWDRFAPGKTVQWIGHGMIAVAMLMITVRYYQQKVFLEGHGYRYLAMAEAPSAPAALLEELQTENVEGIVFNDDAYGGYLLWKAYPRIRPFSDTRQINVPNFQLYNLILHDPQRYWGYADLYNRFQAVILNADKAVNWKLIRFMQQQPEWYLTAVHGEQIVFRRSRKKPLTEFIQSLRAQDPQLEDYRQQLSAIVAAGPKYPVLLERMQPADTAITLFELGYPGAALQNLVYSFEVTDSPYQHRITRLILQNL